MTLEEAIKHAKETAENLRHEAVNCRSIGFPEVSPKCISCAEEHEQLAEWLEELKDYKEGRNTCEFCKHKFRTEYERPCSLCKHNFTDKFEREKDTEENL